MCICFCVYARYTGFQREVARICDRDYKLFMLKILELMPGLGCWVQLSLTSVGLATLGAHNFSTCPSKPVLNSEWPHCEMHLRQLLSNHFPGQKSDSRGVESCRKVNQLTLFFYDQQMQGPLFSYATI